MADVAEQAVPAESRSLWDSVKPYLEKESLAAFALEPQRVDIDRCVELDDLVEVRLFAADQPLRERALPLARTRRFGRHVHAARSALSRTRAQA